MRTVVVLRWLRRFSLVSKSWSRFPAKALFLGIAIHLVTGPVWANTSNRTYEAMGIEPGKVLTGSVLTTRVIPGGGKQVVAMVTYFTGKRDEAQAVNVRLEIFHQKGEALSSVYARDFGKENGGYVARGELELVDLDGDGTNEIIVAFDNLKEPLVRERKGEIILRDKEGFRAAWSGILEYDATRAARKVPVERRDRFEREVDVLGTLKTQGITLLMKKTMIAVAGERLSEPKVVTETFPLRPGR